MSSIKREKLKSKDGPELRRKLSFLVIWSNCASYRKLERKYNAFWDIEKRLKQHGSPELKYKEGPFEKQAAAKRERQIKGWTRVKKAKLIRSSAGRVPPEAGLTT